MNKVSKKIVSLVTMAAFALTLVPAAAFAAPAKTDLTVTKADYNKATVNITLSDNDVTAIGNGNVIVWAEDNAGNVLEVGANKAVTTDAAGWNAYKGFGNSNDNMYYATAAKDMTIDLTFAASGEYTIYAAKNAASASVAGDKDAAKKSLIGQANFYAIGPAVANTSAYGVISGGKVQAEAPVAVDTDLTTTFLVNDDHADATGDTLENVKVWIVDNSNSQVVTLAKMTDEDGTPINTGSNGAYLVGNVENGAVYKLQFSAPGSYTLYAGQGNDLASAKKNPLKGATVVTVTEDTVVDHFDITAKVYPKGTTTPESEKLKFDDTNTAVLDLTQAQFDDFRYNGIDKITLDGQALEENNSPAKDQTINFATTRTDVVEFTKATDTTDNDGKFDTTFTMQDKKNALITVTDEATGLKYTVRVIAATATPQDINRTLTGGYVLAGTDSNWDADYNAMFTDAVQFEVLDDKGEVVTGLTTDDVVIEVRDRADGSDLTKDELAFVDSGNGVYTLKYVGNTPKADLTPGEYEVRVALKGSEDNATVTFTAAKYGTTQDTVLDLYASDYDQSPANPNEEWMTVTDQVTLGQTVSAYAKYVDENGIKIKADGINYGFNGKAVVDVNGWNNRFGTPLDIPANESLIGTEITVSAFNTANKQYVEKTLTVVDSYTDKSLEFDPVQGPTNEDNKVTVSVVNEDGKVQQVEGSLSAWVADQSNEDATISVDTKSGNHAVTNGKGTLTLYSDQETTADIVVVVKAGTEVYAGTLEYTFGTEDPLASRTVVMTIGATEYVVNNNVITGDAAPFVDSNWRTMVPIRALAEAFDAEVIWDDNDRTVTINYDGDTQIVMTVGETDYTVDGADQTMDTEPVIQDGRTYVPIRFAAEGLHFAVTPLYDNAGLTASVVFQR